MKFRIVAGLVLALAIAFMYALSAPPEAGLPNAPANEGDRPFRIKVP